MPVHEALHLENGFGVFQYRRRISPIGLLVRDVEFVTSDVHVLGITPPPKPVQYPPLDVLGTHGETDFSRYVMGGVSSKIVRVSPIPVVWVREPGSSG